MGAVFKLRAQKIVLSENDIERQILDYMRAHGWTPLRCHVGTFTPTVKAHAAINDDREGRDGHAVINRNTITMHPEGTADWLFIHGNYPAWWVEVKAPGKKPSAAQLRFLDERRILRQLATWTDSVESFSHWYVENVIPKSSA
jgi:hypothetical protein